MKVSSLNPYRGPFSYKEGDEDIFYGRNSEVDELISCISKNQLTILYGASGTGKTSLIHAKLLPSLKRQYFHPIYLRINFNSKIEEPLSYVKRRIVEELRIWDTSLPGFEDNQSLIDYAAKNVIFKGLIKPVLFFDQFEELFTLGPKSNQLHIQRFMFEIAELIELRLPDTLKTIDYINNISSFKVVFSLRQDWVGFLDDFSSLIPSIGESRYRLKKFSARQAIDAIINPSQGKVSYATAELIVEKIGSLALLKNDILFSETLSENVANKEVDPFVLSLYCFQLFDKSGEFGVETITPGFVSDQHEAKLIRSYYEERIAPYPAIKLLIEERLLNESGKRIIVPLTHFSSGDDTIIKQTKDTALQTGILRIVGLDSESEVEIIHDRLATQIFECKNERITKQIHQQAVAKENQAEHLRAQAKKAKKKVLVISAIAGVFILGLIGLSLYLYIYAINNFQITGLQRNVEKLKSELIQVSKKAEISENSLVANNDSLKGIITSINLKYRNALASNETESMHRALLLNQFNDSVAHLNRTIQSVSNEKADRDSKIRSLTADLASLKERVNILSRPADISSGSTTTLSKFQPKNLSSVDLISLENADGFDLSDIRRKGFRFKVNLKDISTVNLDSGRIEIRVHTNVSESNNSEENDHKSLKSLADNPFITIPSPKGLRQCQAYFTVNYFISRIDKTSYLELKHVPFVIAKSPIQNEQ